MEHKISTLALLCVCLVMFLSACSSNVPPNIREPFEASPGLSQVLINPESYLSQRLRWGGIILSTENRQNGSQMTIVAFPLNDSGRPRVSGHSPGRFIAVVDEFLEPLVYSRDREITVIGKLVKTEALKVGEYDYDYPVIEVDEFYLWPPKPEVIDYNPPFYGPYYRPYYYPFYPWPHYPHRHFRHKRH